MDDSVKKYIESLSFSDDKTKNLNTLKQLSELLTSKNYEDSFFVCLQLLSNSEKVQSIVGSVVLENIDLIVKNKFSSVYSNLYFDTFIEIYCLNNDISVELGDFLDNNLSYSDDYYYQSIKDIPILTREEEQQLFKLYHSSDPVVSKNARKQIINSNLRLVVSVASKYRSKYIPFDDLISEGNMGLMKAITHFDVSKGFKFSTYAIWWIRQSISRHLASFSGVIKFPARFKSMMGTYNQFVSKWKEEYDMIPSMEEIMVNTGFTSDDIILIQKYANGVTSFSTPIGDDDDTSLGDFIPDLSVSIEEAFEQRNFVSVLYDIFEKLNFSDRDIDMVVMRLGLDGKGERTLEEIGDKYGITRERVRQKVAKSLSKIRKYKKRMDIEEKGMMTKH